MCMVRPPRAVPLSRTPLQESRVNQPLPSQVSLMTLVAPGTALATSAQIQAPLDEKDAKKFLKLHRPAARIYGDAAQRQLAR